MKHTQVRSQGGGEAVEPYTVKVTKESLTDWYSTAATAGFQKKKKSKQESMSR